MKHDVSACRTESFLAGGKKHIGTQNPQNIKMEFGRFRELGNWCKKRTGSGLCLLDQNKDFGM